MLSPTQRAMIAELRHGQVVSTEKFIETVYGARTDGGPDDASRVIRQQIFKMRAKLAPLGVEIETVGIKRGSEGYRLRNSAMLETLVT